MMCRQFFAGTAAALFVCAGAAFGIDVTRPGDAIIPSSPNHPAGRYPLIS